MTNQFKTVATKARTSNCRVDYRHSSGASNESDMDSEGGSGATPDSLEGLGGIYTALRMSKSVPNSEIKPC